MAAPGSAMAANQANNNAAPTDNQPQTRLTSREETVARLISQGRTNREIAEELAISINTVIFHVRNILRKLNFKNRAQIAAWDRSPREH